MISEKDYQRIRRYLSDDLGMKLRNHRIRAIKVNSLQHWQPKMYIETGKFYSTFEINGQPEEVLAIFEAVVFCVCTPGHGDGKGLPYMFTREEVRRVERME
ncbi:MAG: hypothetical protein P9X24_19725 [Candidatus Hatepunaea meridiana]|nr:hypothetical protein [Candidatus Hatepunaea meridiana]